MTAGTCRSIRTIKRSDIAELQRIDKIAHGSAWTHRTYCDEVERMDRIHLIAEVQERIVGHAALWVDDNVGRITNVAVSVDCGGDGHGSALVLALLQRAVQVRSIAHLQLEVRPSNRRAQHIYNQFGFVPVGVERGFYDTGDTRGSRDALVMTVADVCADQWRDRLTLIAAEQQAGAAA